MKKEAFYSIVYIVSIASMQFAPKKSREGDSNYGILILSQSGRNLKHVALVQGTIALTVLTAPTQSSI
jgi:hypothetical protein